MSALIARLVREALPRNYDTMPGLDPNDPYLMMTVENVLATIERALREFQAEAAKEARKLGCSFVDPAADNDEYRPCRLARSDQPDFHWPTCPMAIAAKIEAL